MSCEKSPLFSAFRDGLEIRFWRRFSKNLRNPTDEEARKGPKSVQKRGLKRVKNKKNAFLFY